MRRELAGCSPASLDDVLAEKDARAEAQRAFLLKHGLPVLCLTLNLPGEYKNFRMAGECFALALEYIEEQLPAAADRLAREGKAGYFACLAVSLPELRLKQLALEIEDTHPIGRLLDLDVIAPGGGKLSRRGMGRGGRKCLLCGSDAFICSRSRAHGMDEVVGKVLGMMGGYLRGVHSEKAASLAVRSLLEELSVTPKPGLVDRRNSGAHSDMDFFTFIASAEALRPYFYECARQGFVNEDSPQALFQALRKHGLAAEKAMFRATGGVNTHKGAIFSLGLLCGAYGALAAGSRGVTAEAVFGLAAEMAAPALEDFSHGNSADTSGKRLFGLFGLTGARGEAASGFKSVRNYALPVFSRMMSSGHTLNGAGVAAMLALLAHTDDTNIINRASLQRLRQIQDDIKGGSESPVPQMMAEAERLDDIFISENISPGGCADLLAVTIFMYRLIEEGQGESVGGTE